MTGSEEVGGYHNDVHALGKDDVLELTLRTCCIRFSLEMAVTIPGFSTRIIFSMISTRMTKMVTNVWTKFEETS